ncbi:unnamed protein product [Ectocarpus sp. 12 AP-2014]
MTLLALGAASVVMAADGKEALEMLREKPVDIVISDLNMTPVSGLEFLQSLRAAEDAALARTPVVVVSGYEEDEVKDQVLAAGGDAFMSKPVKPGGIEARVIEILKGQRKQEAALVDVTPAPSVLPAQIVPEDQPMLAQRA